MSPMSCFCLLFVDNGVMRAEVMAVLEWMCVKSHTPSEWITVNHSSCRDMFTIPHTFHGWYVTPGLQIKWLIDVLDHQSTSRWGLTLCQTLWTQKLKSYNHLLGTEHRWCEDPIESAPFIRDRAPMVQRTLLNLLRLLGTEHRWCRGPYWICSVYY